MNAYERRTRPVCPACSDTYLITSDGESVECPLHQYGPPTSFWVASDDVNCEPLSDPKPLISPEYLKAVHRAQCVAAGVVCVLGAGFIAAIWYLVITR
jgi:hypothetical protein